MQAAEDKRSEEAVGRKRDELERHSATYQREKSKDTNGGALAVWLVLSAFAVVALIFAFNRWGGDAVIWAFVLSAIFLGGGLFWGLYPLQAAFEEMTKGTPAKRKFLEQKAEVDKAIAGLAPRQVRLVRLPVEKVGLVIGKGGETIKRITNAGVSVDIQGWHEVAAPSWATRSSYASRPRSAEPEPPAVFIDKNEWERGNAPERPWVRPRKRSSDRQYFSYVYKSAYWKYVDKDFLTEESRYSSYGRASYTETDDEWSVDESEYEDGRQFDDFGGLVTSGRYGERTSTMISGIGSSHRDLSPRRLRHR
jgi:hypothetical protein